MDSVSIPPDQWGLRHFVAVANHAIGNYFRALNKRFQGGTIHPLPVTGSITGDSKCRIWVGSSV
jgi:hypothetical protein